MPADIYEKWISRTAGYLGDGEFVISVPDEATRDFLESKLAITVLGLVREFALPVYEIRYRVSSNKAGLKYSKDAPVHAFDDDMNPVTDVIRWRNSWITWTFLQEMPTQATALVCLVELTCWGGFLYVRRRLQCTGL
jgi:hypothetical protein